MGGCCFRRRWHRCRGDSARLPARLRGLFLCQGRFLLHGCRWKPGIPWCGLSIAVTSRRRQGGKLAAAFPEAREVRIDPDDVAGNLPRNCKEWARTRGGRGATEPGSGDGMKQITAIFIKDTRRFWPEIAITVLLLALFVMVYPVTWQHDTMVGPTFAGRFAIGEGWRGFLASCLVVLVPVSWLVLIARVVHCERLVGDTQFWLTRPYEWPKLVAAKALFLAAFLYLPFLLAQCALLMEAGFNPIAYAVGLGLNLVLVTVILILPAIALSSLTRGFARLMVVLLGFVVIFVVVLVIASYIPTVGNGGTPDLISGWIEFFVLLMGCAMPVWIMYARRSDKDGLACIWRVAAFAVGDELGRSGPGGDGEVFSANSVDSAQVIEISYAAEGLRQPIARDTRDKDELEVSIPVSSSVLQPDHAVVPQAQRVTLEEPDGTRWRSPWKRYDRAAFLPGSNVSSFSFILPRRIYEQWKGASTGLNVEFALINAKQTMQRTIALPEGDFTVDGFGV